MQTPPAEETAPPAPPALPVGVMEDHQAAMMEAPPGEQATPTTGGPNDGAETGEAAPVPVPVKRRGRPKGVKNRPKDILEKEKALRAHFSQRKPGRPSNTERRKLLEVAASLGLQELPRKLPPTSVLHREERRAERKKRKSEGAETERGGDSGPHQGRREKGKRTKGSKEGQGEEETTHTPKRRGRPPGSTKAKARLQAEEQPVRIADLAQCERVSDAQLRTDNQEMQTMMEQGAREMQRTFQSLREECFELYWSLLDSHVEAGLDMYIQVPATTLLSLMGQYFASPASLVTVVALDFGYAIPDSGFLGQYLDKKIRETFPHACCVAFTVEECFYTQLCLRKIVRCMCEFLDIQEDPDTLILEDVIQIVKDSPTFQIAGVVCTAPAIEYFPKEEFGELIRLCSLHVKDIPFVFHTTAMCTTPGMHEHLQTPHLRSCADVRVMDCAGCRENMVTHVFSFLWSSPVPLFFRPEIFVYLRKSCEETHGSFTHLIHFIKVLSLMHIVRQPLGFLPCLVAAKQMILTPDQSLVQELTPFAKSIPSDVLMFCRSQEGFKHFVESLEEDSVIRQTLLTMQDDALRSMVPSLINDVSRRYKRMQSTLHLVSNLMQHPLIGDTSVTPNVLFAEVMQGAFNDRSIQQTVFGLSLLQKIQTLSGASISDLWSVLQPILSDVLSEEGLFATPLRQMAGRLKSCLEAALSQAPLSVDETPSPSMGEAEADGSSSLQESGKRSAEAPLEGDPASKRSRVSNPSEEEARSLCTSFLEEFISGNLTACPASNLPFQEAFTCSFRLSTLNEIFFPNVRAAVSTALSSPETYVRGPSVSVEGDALLAYSLFQSNTRFINLDDWFHCFHVAVLEKAPQPIAHDVVLARFLRAVGELSYVGFVGHLQSKWDHCSRLIYVV